MALTTIPAAGAKLRASVLSSLITEVRDLFAYKTANETVTSSTTLQNDDELFVSVAANSVYRGMLVSFWGGNDAAGAKTAFTVPTGCTTVSGQVSKLSAATGVVTSGDGNFRSVTDTGTTTTALEHGIVDTNFVTSVVYIHLTTGANAGTFRVQFAQITSDGTGTVHRAGSYLVLRKEA